MKAIRILALLLPMALLWSCGGNSNRDIDVDLIENPNSADGYNTDTPMPKAVFDKDMHDFGRITEGEAISYSFHFRNDGNADMIISSCSATCGCTVPDYPRGRVKPGGEGYVTVTFNSQGKQGQQYQEVTVNTNAQPSKYVLKITAQVVR